MSTVTVDRTSQRYSSGPQKRPRCVGLHTTEGGSWPSYGGGGYAPHSTIKPLPGVGIQVREHIDFDDYGRAFENRSGGVETNTAGVIQFELVGTCDERNPHDVYYWPDADDAVLEALADYLRPIMGRYDIPLRSTVTWKSYNKGQRPSSYGLDNGVRLTGSDWLEYVGILGHQHVPENSHGDPGDFPIARLLHFLGASSGGAQSVPFDPPKPQPEPQEHYWTVTAKGYSTADVQRIVDVTVDNLYGPATRAAVRDLQKKLGVTADGYFGPATAAAFEKSQKKGGGKKAPKFPLPRGHWYGPESSDKRNHSGYYKRDRDGIRTWQRRMKKRGWTITPDGRYGTRTASVAESFQREKGLAVDGLVGPVTWKAAWEEPVT